MVIWRGSGIVVVASIVVFAAMQMVLDAVIYDGYYAGHMWPKIVCTLLCAIPLWLYGRAVNNEPPQVLVDPKNPLKKIVIPAKKHDFFFVPLEYWALVVLVVGGWMAATTKPTEAPGDLAARMTDQARRGMVIDVPKALGGKNAAASMTPQQATMLLSLAQAIKQNGGKLPQGVSLPPGVSTEQILALAAAAQQQHASAGAAPAAAAVQPQPTGWITTPVEKKAELSPIEQKRAAVLATMTAPPEIAATNVEQVYVDNVTKLYYDDDCTTRPERTYHMPKRLATQQGFRAATCP